MHDHTNAYMANDKYATIPGIELVNLKKEYARCELEITENHTNGLGSLHGAVIFARADIAFAAACNTVKISIGMQAEIKYLNKPTGNRLIAEAAVVSSSNKIGHYQVNITDNNGIHIAQYNSISYRIKDTGSLIREIRS